VLLEYLTGESLPPTGKRDLFRDGSTATILFLDIADSTPLTERLGDVAFRAQSRQLEASLREIIVHHGGTPMDGKVLGDGLMATYASASRAIVAALACNEAASKTDLSLHLGIHAGDVIHEQGNVYGGAVNMAARVCATSAPGEVLVSETVRALARTSAGVRFEDRGLHELKGIEEPQRLFAVVSG
jgi:class 3 adenylate cyclase